MTYLSRHRANRFIYLSKNKMNRGLTLIETLLYIALLSVLTVTALPLLVDLNSWQSEQNVYGDATRDFLFLEAKVRFLTQRATRIIRPGAGEYSNTLSFDTENVGIITLKSENGLILDYEEEGVESVPLFATSTLVESMAFYRPSTANFEMIMFSAVIRGFNFGTTTYLFRNE